jgi:hypothetical protein
MKFHLIFGFAPLTDTTSYRTYNTGIPSHRTYNTNILSQCTYNNGIPIHRTYKTDILSHCTITSLSCSCLCLKLNLLDVFSIDKIIRKYPICIYIVSFALYFGRVFVSSNTRTQLLQSAAVFIPLLENIYSFRQIVSNTFLRLRTHCNL